MFKIVSGIIGFFLATGLFWLGIAFEHRPAGWPNIPINAGFIHLTLHLPDGPYPQLDAWKQAAQTSAANVKTLQGAVNVQNAAIAQMKATSLAWQAKSQRSTSDAANSNAWRLSTAQRDRTITLPANADAATACVASEALLRANAR